MSESKVSTIDDLAREIAEQDPKYIISQMNATISWRKIRDKSSYPEIKTSHRGSNIVHQVLDTIGNLKYLMSLFDAKISYNLMTRKREIEIPNLRYFTDDEDNDTLARIESLAALNEMPVKNIDKWLNVIAGENAYHPVVDCLKASPWDGVDRLEDFIKTIETTRPEIDKILIKTWMISAIAAIHSPKGFTAHGVLVIQGSQGIGKTSWLRALDPSNCGSVKTGALLDPANKDNIKTFASFWIVELGELDATFKKADIARLKSFITNDEDIVRVPYARRDTFLQRRTVYAATVNSPNFLMDETGNRRWWTIEALNMNYEHGMDMQQVWAQVKYLWDNGALAYLPADLQNTVNINNEAHEIIEPMRELLLTSYDWSVIARYEKSASNIFIELFGKTPNRSESTRFANLLIEINGEKPRRSNGVNIHKIPPIKLKS